jgi:DNA-binding LacI/PurR family transcriptional regulator
MPNVTAQKKREPLYRQIAKTLKEEIKTNYSPNDAIPPQRQLVERFNTSNMTINQAIKELVDEGILTRTERKGTFVRDTQHIAQGLVGLLISGRMTTYVNQMFGTINQKLREARFRPVLYVGNNNYEEELQSLREMGSFNEMGMISYSLFLEQMVEQYKELMSRGIPLVMINHPIEGADCARVDHFQIGALQANYLMEKQVERILYIDDQPDTLGINRHMEGFLSTFIASHRSLKDIQVEYFHREGIGEEAHHQITEQIRRIMHRIYSQPSAVHPKTIVVYGDYFLPAIVEDLKTFGIEPGRDVMLMGTDNMDLKGFPYVTVDESLAEIGSEAARLLIERIEGKYSGPPRSQYVSPKLVEHSG